jgi:3-hydroxyacyl-CoA dehydrogenase
MSDAASYSVRDGIAVITMNNPPVNSMSAANRVHVGGALKKADADPAVKAIVLIGSEKAFSGGAEIREFNTDKSRVSQVLPELNDIQDSLKKPLVARSAVSRSAAYSRSAAITAWRCRRRSSTA